MRRFLSADLAVLTFVLLGACGIDFEKKDKILDDAGEPTKPDSGGIVSRDCRKSADCGDTERYECVAEKCVEYECYAGKPCSGTEVCESHKCAAFVPPERLPASYFQSSGGGTSASTQYTLRMSAGMPQPMGVMSSGMYSMTIGPGAGRP